MDRLKGKTGLAINFLAALWLPGASEMKDFGLALLFNMFICLLNLIGIVIYKHYASYIMEVLQIKLPKVDTNEKKKNVVKEPVYCWFHENCTALFEQLQHRYSWCGQK